MTKRSILTVSKSTTDKAPSAQPLTAGGYTRPRRGGDAQANFRHKRLSTPACARAGIASDVFGERLSGGITGPLPTIE